MTSRAMIALYLCAAIVVPVTSVYAQELGPNTVFVHPPGYVQGANPEPNIVFQRPGYVFPNGATQPPQQPAGGTVMLSDPRASSPPRAAYDPGARNGVRDSPLGNDSGTSKALRKLNPNDVNYGGLLAQWRIVVVQETIESVYWWTLLVMSFAFGSALAYLYWLLRESDTRLNISAGNFAQLWNSYVHARNKALEAIAAHNRWVSEIDRKHEAAVPLGTSTLIANSTPALFTEGQPALSADIDALNMRDRAFLPAASPKLVLQSPATICAAITEARLQQCDDKQIRSSQIVAGQTNGSRTPGTEPDDATGAPGTADDGTQEEKLTPAVQQRLKAREDKIANQRLLIRKLQDEIVTLKGQASGTL